MENAGVPLLFSRSFRRVFPTSRTTAKNRAPPGGKEEGGSPFFGRPLPPRFRRPKKCTGGQTFRCVPSPSSSSHGTGEECAKEEGSRGVVRPSPLLFLPSSSPPPYSSFCRCRRPNSFSSLPSSPLRPWPCHAHPRKRSHRGSESKLKKFPLRKRQ